MQSTGALPPWTIVKPNLVVDFHGSVPAGLCSVLPWLCQELIGLGWLTPSDSRLVGLTVTDTQTYTQTTDTVLAFLGLSDPQGAGEIAANVAGGMLIIGDVGSLAKNAWRYLGFTDAEPDH